MVEINAKVQELMTKIAGSESQLMQNPSPYSNVNPTIPVVKDDRKGFMKMIPDPVKKIAKLFLKLSDNTIKKYILC